MPLSPVGPSIMFEDRYLKVDGTKIRYFDEGSGRVVVLVHGLGGSAVNWLRNIKPLSQKYRVIALDLPSFGQSEMPKGDLDRINYDFMAGFLKRFLKTLGVKKTTVVGNSMGGGIATAFAFKFPKTIERLVIVDGAGLGRQISSLYRPMAFPGLNRIFFKLISREAIARSLVRFIVYDPSTLDKASFYAFVNWIRKPEVQDIMAKIGPKAIGTRGQRWLFVDGLKKLSSPILIVWGKNDRILPSKHGLKAHKLIKGSELVVFDRCGHAPQIEKPEEFNRELLKFLAR